MNNDPNNVPMVDAVAGQPASRRGFRGCTGFAVHAVACVALLFAGPLPSAEAQTQYTWKTSAAPSAIFQGGTNWQGDVAPSATTDIAVFRSTTPVTLSPQVSATSTTYPSLPNIGQLNFDNSGTTNLITTAPITLNSGTGIYLSAASGLVSITGAAGVVLNASQTWWNDSTTASGTLSIGSSTPVNIGTNRNLTLAGPGAIRIGQNITSSTTSGFSTVTYEGSNTLFWSGNPTSSFFNFTLKSGTLRNENSNGFTWALGRSGTVRIEGGAISQNGSTRINAGEFLMSGSFSVVSGSFYVDPTLRANSGPVEVTVAPGVSFGRSTTGALFGTSKITKKGAGEFLLTTTTGTGFSGGFELNEGLLRIAGTGTSPLGTGTFTISGGTISGDGFTGLTMPSRFAGNFSVGGTSAVNLGSGTVTLAATPTVNVVSSTVTFTIGGPIVGENTSFGLTKNGPGQLTLNGTNTYAGTTRVNSGTINLGNALGLQNSGLDTDGSGKIVYSTSTTSITLGGLAGSSNLGTVIASGFSSGTSLTLNPQAGNSYSYSGVIANFGTNLALTKTGAGEQILTGANTFSGQTTIAAGTLSVNQILDSGSNSPLGTNGTVNFGGSSTSGLLRYTGSGETTTRVFNLVDGSGGGGIENNGSGALVISSAVTAAGTGSRVFRLSGTNTGSNRIVSIAGTNVSVEKSGVGTWQLTGASTYNGTTTVSAGILEIGNGGVINTSSGVTVNGAGAEFKYNSSTAFSRPLTLTQGILSGTGTIQTAVTVGSSGTISPGNSPGSQTYTSSQWLQDGTYKWELNALTGVAGTNWDRVAITGLLNLTGLSASNKFNIDLTTLTGSNTDGPLDSAYVSGPTYIFPFVDFGSLTVPAGFTTGSNSDLTALFNFDLTKWVGTSKPSASDISVKVNSTGNGLNLVIVPEPATIALAGIGIGTAVWFFRRRRAA